MSSLTALCKKSMVAWSLSWWSRNLSTISSNLSNNLCTFKIKHESPATQLISYYKTASLLWLTTPEKIKQHAGINKNSQSTTSSQYEISKALFKATKRVTTLSIRRHFMWTSESNSITWTTRIHHLNPTEAQSAAFAVTRRGLVVSTQMSHHKDFRR